MFFRVQILIAVAKGGADGASSGSSWSNCSKVSGGAEGAQRSANVRRTSASGAGAARKDDSDGFERPEIPSGYVKITIENGHF